ncbi:hypothetical protein [Croceivirga sp. JEA036]|uniref:hypothetical protein n=1 Tax=Croceivirga sp. JEA036 TaxID=2721162 RepID=UPI00143AA17A|nr:hypothetical protein [Croceivirga sp. JEA036]NJB37572.1 hypothetical protein [Croceivirga sp. JEA036]
MNRNQLLFNGIGMFLLPMVFWAQGKSRTYTETFNVGEETVLEINTSHTDIAFEAWDKNQVEIIATVTVEEATDEEVKNFFKNEPFTILGNSKKIAVNSRDGSSTWQFMANDFSGDVYMDVEPIFLDLEIPDLPEVEAVIGTMPAPPVPPLPPMPNKTFDYEKFKAEGESYLKEWSKDFEKGFDKEYQKKMEEWSKKVEEQVKQWEKKHGKRAKAMEKRAELMEERAQKRAELQERRQEIIEERILAREDVREAIRISRANDTPSVFYYNNAGKSTKYKVKRELKIKLPKSVRLKMNVKHGEVKLASLTKNLEASLRYASLLGQTIDGDHTTVSAAYSPIEVQKWNLGQLNTKHSDAVYLKEVGELQYTLVSSNAKIGKVNSKAYITNNLGKLSIAQLGQGFKDVDVTLVNGELNCKLPTSPLSLYVNGTASEVSCSKNLQLERTTNNSTVIYKGYQQQKNGGGALTINAKYSEVVLE